LYGQKHRDLSRKRRRGRKNFGLFKDSVSNSGYAQSNGRIVKEYRINNYVDVVVAYFEDHYKGFFGHDIQ
jgi:hypothetical protein